ncbi:MAG TPA: DUF885 family protein, partial [Caulobacteraceae bacterium]
MLDRRSLLTTAAAGSALAACNRTPGAAGSGDETAKLNTAMTAIFQEVIARSPETATSLGLDKGEGAAAKSKLDDRSLAAVAADKRRAVDQLARLRTVRRDGLTGLARVNYDVVEYGLRTQVEADRRFNYASTGSGAPYVLSQLTGAYQSVPDFLDNQHAIETAADADAYLARLDTFGAALDQETERARHDAGLGVVPPDFVIDKALVQMRGLRGQSPENSVLVQSVVRRTGEKSLSGDWGARAASVYTGKIAPALDRQIALLEEWRRGAVHDAGVWRLPEGEAYYAASLAQSTTTTMSPAEVHRIGLEQVRILSEEIGRTTAALGMTTGTPGERMRAMARDAQYLYANTDAAKEQLIADLNGQVRAIQARLPEFFSTLPRSPVDIRRVPKYI